MLCRLFLLFIVFFTPLVVSASEYDVLLDASGSMRGFKKANNGKNWKSFLGGMQQNTKKLCKFGNKYVCYIERSAYDIKLNDQNTDLAGALKAWLKAKNSYQNLLIITDNVADINNKSSKANQNMFEKLISGKTSMFSHVAIFTVRLPFDGKVYPLESYKKKSKPNYSKYKGDRALVLYVLSKQGITDNSFEKYRDSIKKNLKLYDYKLFQVRPFATNEVKQSFGDVKIDTTKSNQVKIKPVKQKDGRTAILISNYKLGKPLNFNFDIDLEIQGAFKLKDINLKSSIKFDGLPPHLTSQGHTQNDLKFEAVVVPSEVTLSPNKVQGFNIAFKINRFKFTDIPFKQKLKFALSNTQDIKGKLDLLFSVTKDQYIPYKQAFLDWTHDSAEQLGKANSDIQKKVFGLDAILATGVSDKVSEENLKEIPINLEIRYTMGPIITAIALIMLLLGVLYWLLLKSRNSQDYVIEDDMGGQKPLSIGFGQTYKHFDDRGRNLFSLRFLGFAYFVTSRFKLEGSRMLGSGQSFEILDSESDTYHSFYLRQLENDSSTGTDDSYDW